MATLGIKVVVRPGQGLGFQLAGAAVEEIARGEEAARFTALLADPHLGVLAVEETLLAAAPERPLRRAHQRGLPVVLPFALPQRWTDEKLGQRYVAALIRRAVGYHIKLGREGAP
jgi:V/A-type H+/Na+-transporting ATPase subunit F